MDLMLLVILTLSLGLLPLTESAGNSLGSPCIHDSDCTGVNEYCRIASWLDPPCYAGMCTCLPCYTSNASVGYLFGTSPCMNVTYLTVGDACTFTVSNALNNYAAFNEIILTVNAYCSSTSRVSCFQDSVQFGSSCVKRGGAGELEDCTSDDDCAGEMACNEYSYQCSCPDGWKYQSSSGFCIRRVMYDSCSYSEDCVIGNSIKNWDGYTRGSGYCSDDTQTCMCDENNDEKITEVAYADDSTGGKLVKTKICATGYARTDLSIGSSCILYPLTYSQNSPNADMCASDLICAFCPEDSPGISNSAIIRGKCRKLKNPIPMTVNCLANATDPEARFCKTKPPTKYYTPPLKLRQCYIGQTNACRQDEICMSLSYSNDLMAKGSTCKMGICVPQTSSILSFFNTLAKSKAVNGTNSTNLTSTTASTTTTKTTTTKTGTLKLNTRNRTVSTNNSEPYPRRYGLPCNYNGQCGTGLCNTTTKTCSCPSCARFIIGWRLIMTEMPMRLELTESCIPEGTPVVSEGQACDDFHTAVPTSVCDTTSICSKCPEYWSNPNVPPTCLGIAFRNSTNCTCGYLANCSIVSGNKACTCPPGYQLHLNGKDCYGWKTKEIGQCDATCGNGIQKLIQECDAPDSLKYLCSGISKLANQSCSTTRCPYNPTISKYVVDLCITSKLMSIDGFNDVVTPAIKAAVSKNISEQCRDNTTFKVCCPNSIWQAGLAGLYVSPSGVSILNPYKSNQVFCFGLMVKSDAIDSFCNQVVVSQTKIPATTVTAPPTTLRDNLTTTAVIGRKKRASDASTPLDQASLLTILKTSSVFSGIKNAIQLYDPTASVSSSGFSIVTVTTTSIATMKWVDLTTIASAESETTRYIDRSKYVIFGDTYVSIWVICVGVICHLVLFGVVVIVVYLACRKPKQIPNDVSNSGSEVQTTETITTQTRKKAEMPSGSDLGHPVTPSGWNYGRRRGRLEDQATTSYMEPSAPLPVLQPEMAIPVKDTLGNYGNAQFMNKLTFNPNRKIGLQQHPVQFYPSNAQPSPPIREYPEKPTFEFEPPMRGQRQNFAMMQQHKKQPNASFQMNNDHLITETSMNNQAPVKFRVHPQDHQLLMKHPHMTPEERVAYVAYMAFVKDVRL